MNWLASGRARSYSIRRPSRSFECIDHQLHAAAEAALDQDGVAGGDGPRKDRRERGGIPGVRDTDRRGNRGVQFVHQRAAGEQAIGGGGDIGGEGAMFVGA